MDVGAVFISLLTRLRDWWKAPEFQKQLDDYARWFQADVDFERKRNFQLEKALHDRSEEFERQIRLKDSRILEFEERAETLSKARIAAESRLEDCRESLKIERDRYDNLLRHAQEVELGIRARVGLVPRPAGESSGKSPQPIQTRRKPFDQVRAELERDSAAKAAQWTEKIRQVEEADKKNGTVTATATDQGRSVGSEPAPNSGAPGPS